MPKGFLIILAVAAIIAILAISSYNKMVISRENVYNAKNQIAVQTESRRDVLKNLIAAAKDYGKFESETLEKIASYRSPVTRKSSTAEIEKEEKNFRSALNGFYAVSEKYPELKTSELYKKAMDSIDNYEDKVRHARMFYNDAVTIYSRKIRTFPSSLFAGIFGFENENYLEENPEKSEMPMRNE